MLILIAAFAYADQISKEAWIKYMSTALPTAFCQSNQYFRQCFNVTQAECVDTAFSATRSCLEQYKDEIPDILNQSGDGSHWGRIIRSCASESYELALHDKLIQNEKCSNPDYWR